MHLNLQQEGFATDRLKVVIRMLFIFVWLFGSLRWDILNTLNLYLHVFHCDHFLAKERPGHCCFAVS